MFKEVRLESQKELFLKCNHPLRNHRYTLRKPKPLTDKITNITFTKENHPKNTEISSGQQYLNDILNNNSEPYKDKYNSRKLSKINLSRNIQNKTFIDNNQSLSGGHNSNNFRNFSNFNKCKTMYNKKRSKSYFSTRTFDKEKILRTTNNSRIRKIYSMASDIFNLEDYSTNLVRTNGSFYNDNNYSVSNYNLHTEPLEYIHLGNEKNFGK